LQDDEAHEIIEDGKNEEFLVDPQHGLTMEHVHLHRGLELRQMDFGFSTLGQIKQKYQNRHRVSEK
jgi:hypothetical protein